MRLDDSLAPTGASWLALALSGGLHAAIVVGVTALYSAPSLDIEFTVPTEVEFGLTEEASATLSGPSSPPLPEQEQQDPQQTGEAEQALSAEEEALREEKEQKEAEAKKRREEARRRRRQEAERQREEAREAQLAKNQEVAEEEVRLPAGAQIALRLDMARVRASPLRGSVSRLLSEIPDWQMMLSGSDISPVEELDRLMVASATLQRGSWLVAGRVEQSTEMIVPITQKMASSRGKSASWGSAHGVRTAPWHDDEAADHVVAIWDNRHFSITRPDDLPRLLAVAGALADASADKESIPPSELADTLMEMGETQAIKVDIEGARRFARAPGHVVPKSLRVSVKEVEGGAELHAQASFDSVSQAQQGLSYWKGLRDQWAGKTLIRALGYGRLLDGIEFEQQGSDVRARSKVRYREIETLLTVIEDWLRARNRQIEQQRQAADSRRSVSGSSSSDSSSSDSNSSDSNSSGQQPSERKRR